MARRMEFTGHYAVVGRRSLTPADWYVGFKCKSCDLKFAMMDEPTHTGEVEFGGQALFSATCPGCGKAADYGSNDLLTFQAAQGGPTSTA